MKLSYKFLALSALVFEGAPYVHAITQNIEQSLNDQYLEDICEEPDEIADLFAAREVPMLMT